MRRFAAFATLAALVALVPGGEGARAAELRRMEAVGAVPIAADEPSQSPPRDAALKKALADAVRRVALDLLPELDPRESGSLLEEVLGDDPLTYATRFRILEDRGERPALFAESGATTEYVVVVEVLVDAARVRERLAEQGLLVLPSGEDRERVTVEVRELASYAAFQALRRALADTPGVRATELLEMERGRAVLAVEGSQEAPSLLQSLLVSAPEWLSITALERYADALVLRVELLEMAGRATDGREGPPPARPGHD